MSISSPTNLKDCPNPGNLLLFVSLLSPQDHTAEDLLHRFVVPIQACSERSEVLFSFLSFQSTKVERGKPCLQRHLIFPLPLVGSINHPGKAKHWWFTTQIGRHQDKSKDPKPDPLPLTVWERCATISRGSPPWLLYAHVIPSASQRRRPRSPIYSATQATGLPIFYSLFDPPGDKTDSPTYRAA